MLQYSLRGILPEWATSREYSAAFLLASVPFFRARGDDSPYVWLVIYYYVKYGMYLVERWMMIQDDKDGGQIVVDVNLYMRRRKYRT